MIIIRVEADDTCVTFIDAITNDVVDTYVYTFKDRFTSRHISSIITAWMADKVDHAAIYKGQRFFSEAGQ